jgi:hypothetical protein
MKKMSDAMSTWHAGAAGVAVLVVMLPTAAGATPIGATGASALAGDRPVQAVEQVAERYCRWRNGVRHCRWSGPRVYGYYDRDYRYGNPRPEAYPTGSAAWWRAMERYGRTGQPPR